MKLVRDHISRDITEAIDTLAEGVRSGQISGIVFGCSIKGQRRYFVNVAGSLAKDPTLARGVLAAIDDELMGMVQSQAENHTTIL